MCHNRKAKKHWNKKQGKAHYKEVNLKKKKKTVDRKRKKRETFAFLTTSTEPSDDVAG